jgi:hypothetical protein
VSRTRQEWIALAAKRALSVLQTHKCCPIRMLEAKICEAGPGDQRPNPVSLTGGIRQLTDQKLIHVIPKRSPTETPFYAPVSADIASAPFVELLNTRRHLYLVHKGLTERDDFCSQVLEKIVDTAIDRSGVAPKFLSRFPSQNLPKNRPLDFVVEIGGTLWGGEDKNFREWFYPDSQEIWAAISKCCEIDAVPLLITRKLPYVTFLFFGKAGMVGFQTHFQFFHPVVAPELARVKAVDGLGYKDIHCTLEPSEQLTNFFARTIPKIAPDFLKRFAARKALLKQYADTAGLASKDLDGRHRTKIFASAWKDIVGSDFAAHVT